MYTHLRIARPVSDLKRSVTIYCKGLGLQEIGRFEDHQGFDGVMIGNPGLSYHFEFTYCRAHPIRPAPTPEDLIVIYLPEPSEWQKVCSRMLEAGFGEERPFNPYWQQRGRMFKDHDGYRIVVEQAAWRIDGDS
ncbi:MAG: VOC family protein [Gammaproteobacteria bacterium]